MSATMDVNDTIPSATADRSAADAVKHLMVDVFVRFVVTEATFD